MISKDSCKYKDPAHTSVVGSRRRVGDLGEYNGPAHASAVSNKNENGDLGKYKHPEAYIEAQAKIATEHTDWVEATIYTKRQDPLTAKNFAEGGVQVTCREGKCQHRKKDKIYTNGRGTLAECGTCCGDRVDCPPEDHADCSPGKKTENTRQKAAINQPSPVKIPTPKEIAAGEKKAASTKQAAAKKSTEAAKQRSAPTHAGEGSKN